MRTTKKSALRNATPGLPVVGVGSSAGGLEAMTALLQALAVDTGMAFVFTQHLPRTHTSLLGDILRRATLMPVVDVTGPTALEPNHVYVVPAGHAVGISGGVLKPIATAEVQHRPIDRFFSQLAEDRGHLAIGVVLSGTATDGTLGLEAIKAAGGITFAQDATAQQEGMPRSAVSAGCVDFVQSPVQIAHELARLARLPLLDDSSALPSGDGSDYEQVVTLLRQESGVDFSQYKVNTLQRRIRRRMALHRLNAVGDYLKMLKGDAREVEALYGDVLIGVTSFFRDPEAFDALKATVFPGLFAGRSRHDPVRVWVLGCATGEEAYSLAIALREYATEVGSQASVVVYATDLNNAAVERARAGLYPKSIESDLTPERLRRYFVAAEGGYRISKAVRDVCIFARQNVLTDPPFSRMDLISCRNVMIYMEASLQRRLMPLLHYALKPGGVLFLGPSETLGTSRDLFDPEDSRHKVFRKRAGGRSEAAFPVTQRLTAAERPSEQAADPERRPQVDLQREAERTLLARYAPAGVLVAEDFEILQFRGDTGLYLSPAPGRATLNLLKMAREGLMVPVRALMQKARREQAVAHESGVKVRSNGGYTEVALTVVPVTGALKQLCWWVLFERADQSPPQPAPPPIDERTLPAEIEERDRQIARLTQELAGTREYLQSVIEQQEAANEELQSANEEVQSANEELQSVNEELETSKEEIQSSNEELTTVNEELHNRNDELARANNDLNNIFASVPVAIVMVWSDLRIRRFTPLAERVFNLIAADIGRPISDIKVRLGPVDLPRMLTESIEAVEVREAEVQDDNGRWYQLRVRPYRTADNAIDGAVVLLVDIERLKQALDLQHRQAQLLEQTHEAIFVHRRDGRIEYWNRGAEALYGWPRDEAVGRSVQSLLRIPADVARLAAQALDSERQYNAEVAHVTRDGRELVVESRQVLLDEGERALVLASNRDVTERKALEQSLRARVEDLAATDRHKNEFLAMLAHELRNPMAPLLNAARLLRSGVDAATQAKSCDIVARQVLQMARMVDDLLDAAQVARGQVRLRIETLDMKVVVARAVESVRGELDKRRHRLSQEAPAGPLPVRGDPARLEQVFVNLLQNAAKYTPDGGTLALTLSTVEVPGGTPEVAVRVRDNGIGIAPEVLPSVFDLFVQADRTLAHPQGGLGIGLHLVRSLVRLHRGRVTASSPGLGQGSEFVVYLPATSRPLPPPAAGMPAALSPLPALPPLRILVVDDNADIVETASILLGAEGHAVTCATRGSEALELAAETSPQVVLLDLGLPDLDGYEVARQLRTAPGGDQLLLIAVSGYGDADTEQRAAKAGFDRLLTKPVAPATIGACIADLLALRARAAGGGDR